MKKEDMRGGIARGVLKGTRAQKNQGKVKMVESSVSATKWGKKGWLEPTVRTTIEPAEQRTWPGANWTMVKTPVP